MILYKQISALLILILILSFLIILNSTPRTESIYKHKVYLYPNILKKLDKVSNIDINKSGRSLHFSRNTAGEWKILNNENYPARANLINDLLLGVAYLKIVEKKTRNPKSFSLLQVDDFTKQSSNATVIIFKDSHSKILVNLLVGKKHKISNFSAENEQIYVRKNGDQQSWLVEGKLPSSLEFKDWVTQPLLPISAKDIHKLTISNIHTNAKSPIIFYKNHKQDHFYFKNSSATSKQENTTIEKSNSLVYLLSNLEYQNATSYSELADNWRPSLKIEIDTGEDYKINLELAKLNQQIYARVIADLSSNLNSEISHTNEVTKLLKDNDGWVFHVEDDIYNLANTSAQDLVKALK